MDITVKISDEHLGELRQKHTTYSLGKILNHDTAPKILNGDANITLKNFCKLCKAMGWEYPEQLKIIEK